jgi:hypothetical protein
LKRIKVLKNGPSVFDRKRHKNTKDHMAHNTAYEYAQHISVGRWHTANYEFNYHHAHLAQNKGHNAKKAPFYDFVFH